MDALPQLVNESTGNKAIGPLVRETFELVQGRRSNAAAFEQVIAQVRNYLTTADLMTRDPIIQRQIGQLPEEIRSGALGHTFRQALTYCYRLLLSEYGPKKLRLAIEEERNSEFHTVVNLLDELAAVNGGELVVYTTNYDCSFQVLSALCETLSFVTHISNEDGLFRDKWYPAVPDFDDGSRQRIFVNRLHGCVGWFDSDRSPFRVEEVYGAGEAIEIHDDDKINQMAIKLASSRDVGSGPAFRYAFEEFEQHLHSARALFVWGYRFGDEDVVRTIVNSANHRRGSLPCVYLDPYLSPEQALGQIHETLRDVPVRPSPTFRPVRIDWKPRDGHDRLVRRTLDFLKQFAGKAK